MFRALAPTLVRPLRQQLNLRQLRLYGTLHKVLLPPIGDSISQGKIIEFRFKVGDRVEEDAEVASIESDKLTVPVRAPKGGVIRELLAEAGTTQTVGTPLFVLEEGAEGAAQPAAAAAGAAAPQQQQQPAAAAAAAPTQTPAAAAKPAAAAAAPASSGGATAPATTAAGRLERRVPMSSMRKTIANRLKESQNTAAMLTTFQEIDMHPLTELRNRHRDEFQKRHGVKLGFMSAFVKASATALMEMPAVNASLEGEEIVYHDYADIGVAVATKNGLIVPILRDAHLMDFAGIEKAIKEYGDKAAAGRITMQDLTGGTFTISNGGTFGSLFGTPIINPPQSAILGMHNIVKRVVPDEQDRPVVRPVMVVALTYDHRMIDGREAVTFLVKIKKLIEDPARLLLAL